MQRRRLFPLLCWMGIALLIPALLLSWYSVSSTTGSGNIIESFYLGHAQLSSPGSNWTSSYSDASLPDTGSLYAEITIVFAAGLVVGVATGIVSILASRKLPRWIVIALSFSAVALVALAPALLAAFQPSAVCSDASNFPPPLGQGVPSRIGGPGCTWSFDLRDQGWYGPGQPSGPGLSFAGHSAQYSGNLTWGPGPAWFLAIAGAALIGTATTPYWRPNDPT